MFGLSNLSNLRRICYGIGPRNVDIWLQGRNTLFSVLALVDLFPPKPPMGQSLEKVELPIF
jgi:hypothetical protein